MNRRRSGVLLFILLVACGGKQTASHTVQTARLPPPNDRAVSKMVQGVEAAKEPNGRARAVSLFREAVSIDPNLWEAKFDLGVLLATTGDLAGAEVQLAAAAKLAPDAQDVATALGEVRRRRGENKGAAEGLADFVEAHQAALDARTLYVAALRDSGQLDKAIKEAQAVLVRKPSDASALAELALCYLAKGEKDTAALLAKQATDSNPHSAIAYRATGLIALANGDDPVAFVNFHKAAQEDPRDTTARLNMGTVLLRAGAYAKAEEQYREILKVSPDDTDAIVGLAAALRGESDEQHKAKLDEARQLLEKVLDKDPHDVAALFNLGVLQADYLKQPAQAQPYFKRFLDDAPGDHPQRADAERYLSATTDPGAGKPPAPGPAPAPSPPAGAPK
jgi:Flp pilus assembly protein TadD